MKKEYIKPTLQETKVVLCNIMNNSPLTGTNVEGLRLGGGTSSGGITFGNAKDRSDDNSETSSWDSLW